MNNLIHQRLSILIDQPVTKQLLSHVAHQASLVISCQNTTEYYNSGIPPLTNFVHLLAHRSEARAGTLLASLVILDKIQKKLAVIAKGMPCTRQRIFLATLIITNKVLHDASPKNKHWTKYASYFTLKEINLMEKQLLAILGFSIHITENDLLRVFINYQKVVYQNACLQSTQPVHYYLPKSVSLGSVQSSNQHSCKKPSKKKVKYSSKSEINLKIHSIENEMSYKPIVPDTIQNISASTSTSSISTVSNQSTLENDLSHTIDQYQFNLKQYIVSNANAMINTNWFDPTLYFQSYNSPFYAPIINLDHNNNNSSSDSLDD